MALRSGALVGEGLVSFGSSAFKLCLGEKLHDEDRTAVLANASSMVRLHRQGIPVKAPECQCDFPVAGDMFDDDRCEPAGQPNVVPR